MVLATRGEFYRAGWFIVSPESSTPSTGVSRASRAPERGSARSSTASSTL